MNDHIKVLSVNVSEKKGVIKKPVEEIELSDIGVVGDAHSGSWHRQVSMLGVESFEKFSKQAGREIAFGEFAENITTEGMLLYECKPFDLFISGDIILEVTQIGKKCHGDNCAIFREVGNCVMPKEGIFCRVVKGGKVKAGAVFEYIPRVFSSRIITLSDRAYKGEYDDLSGPRITNLLSEYFDKISWKLETENIIIPDEEEKLDLLLKDAREKDIDIVITTGGTGIGHRDISPEVVSANLDKEIPGIMDMIRMKFGADKPNALLSRSIAGVMGNTLVFVLPGSLKAVNEYMPEIFKSLQHMFLMLHGINAH